MWMSLSLFFLFLGILLVYVVVLRPIYNLFFHPLRKFPGPKLWAVTQIPYQITYISGNVHHRILELHQKYGDVVRVAPNQLSYLRPDAWKEIMGYRKGGSGDENGKDPVFYKSFSPSIISSDTANHGRYRRMLSHGFSAQNMLENQPLILQYVDLLIKRLHEKSAGGSQLLDIVSWFNFTTFDIIGDLAFGEPFGCLKGSGYHPWVALIFKNLYQKAVVTLLRRHISIIEELMQIFVPGALTARMKHSELAEAKVQQRIAHTEPRPDFMQGLIHPDEGKAPLTMEELAVTAGVLIVAGSETTATALIGTAFYLGTHPEVLARLTEEVFSSFSSEDEIDLINVQKLKYMHAVLQESLRMLPPVPSALPRITPASGNVIFGDYIPPGTLLDIWQWPMYHNPKCFALPNEFHPERWLGEDPRFENDQRDACQPFSYGSRNCIGKNLAYAEMRLILTRLIWNFELRLDDSSLDWEKNLKVYSIWQKVPLYIRLTPRALHQSK